MGAKLVSHIKVVEDGGNVLEIKIWELPAVTEDKPHGFKYSLVYVVDGVRVVGYDNAEGKGDHRHYRDSEKPYEFRGVDKLIDDFYRDVRRFRK